MIPRTSTDTSPIFIAGHGRSGTTLLRKMISAHSRISITPETHYMKWVDKRGNIDGSPDDFDAFWDEYTSWDRFIYLNIDPDYCLRLIEQGGERSFKSIFRAVITAYRERNGKARAGEKSPSHLRYLPHLLSWFPDARIIIMQRDPRAVVASLLDTPWVLEQITPTSMRRGLLIDSRIQQLIEGAEDWANNFRDIVPVWEVDPRVLVVEYAELCESPEGQMRAICQFVGEDFERDMLSDERRRNISASDVKSVDSRLKLWVGHHKNTQDPVSTVSIDRWKGKLTKLEVALVEACCRQVMKERGYSPTTSSFIGLASRALLGTIQAATYGEGQSRNAYRWVRSKIIGERKDAR